MKLNKLKFRIKPSNERRISPEILEKYLSINFLIDDFIEKGIKVEVKSVLVKYDFSEVTYYNIRNFIKNDGILVINEEDIMIINKNTQKYKYMKQLVG